MLRVIYDFDSHYVFVFLSVFKHTTFYPTKEIKFHKNFHGSFFGYYQYLFFFLKKNDDDNILLVRLENKEVFLLPFSLLVENDLLSTFYFPLKSSFSESNLSY